MSLLSLFRARKKGKEWPKNPEEWPWFDQPDAVDILNRRAEKEKLGAEDRESLRQWVADGWCVRRGLVPLEDIDSLSVQLDGLWEADRPIDGIQFEGIVMEPGRPPENSVSHARILALDPEKRRQVRQGSRWRIHGLHFALAESRRIFENKGLRRIAALINGCDTQPTYSITFMYGSEQDLHQDLAVFHIYPRNNLIGMWLALEDITADCGPLVYYPGSHKEPLYAPYDVNYPQTNAHSGSEETKRVYEAHLEKVAKKYEKRVFLGKKGDVLFWHAMLIHGGDGVKNPATTRRSFVVHYLPPGVDKLGEVEGPFLW